MKPTLLVTLLSASAPCALATSQNFVWRTYAQAVDEELGKRLGTVGDLNGDGVAEVLAAGTDLVRVLSGRTGVILRTLRTVLPNSNFGDAVAGTPDVTGDGVPDILVGASYRSTVHLFSGATGLLQRSIAIAGENDLGGHLAVLNDVDGDGMGDFVSSAYGAQHFVAVSGRTGARLYATPYVVNTPDDLALSEIGDADGDGAADFAVGNIGASTPNNAGEVAVCSGRTGAILRRLAPSGTFAFGRSLAAAGDLDGDGRADHVVGSPSDSTVVQWTTGSVWVFSGRTGAMLRRWFVPAYLVTGRMTLGARVAGVGDLNHDGVADVAASLTVQMPQGDFEWILVFSARDGHVLMVVPTDVANNERNGGLRILADSDGDGTMDFAVGLRRDSTFLPQAGSVLVVSGRPFASTTPIGTSCGAGPFLPDLRTTRPILGQSATLAGQFAPANAAGVVLWSGVPPRPLDLNGGCLLHLDVLSILPLVVVPNPGLWSAPLPLPADPTFAGLPLRLQALFFPTAGFLGLDLTNGVDWRLGY